MNKHSVVNSFAKATSTPDYSAEIVIINEALHAARIACEAHINANPDVWWPCGFAWVKIKPTRGRLINAMKQLKVGYVDKFAGGFTVYNPAGDSTQWMDAKEIGCDAFVQVLKKHYPNLLINVYTRMD